MRTNTPFDSRMQPMGVYIGPPPNRFPAPIIAQNMPIQQGFAPMMTQSLQHQNYQMHIPQGQINTQYVNEVVRAPRK